jgi:hypothetical protein
MKCLFHDWIYEDRKEVESSGENEGSFYEKRTCRKCGKVQENDPYFDTSFGMRNNLINRWTTIGYCSSYTRSKSQ